MWFWRLFCLLKGELLYAKAAGHEMNGALLLARRYERKAWKWRKRSMGVSQ